MEASSGSGIVVPAFFFVGIPYSSPPFGTHIRCWLFRWQTVFLWRRPTAKWVSYVFGLSNVSGTIAGSFRLPPGAAAISRLSVRWWGRQVVLAGPWAPVLPADLSVPFSFRAVLSARFIASPTAFWTYICLFLVLCSSRRWGRSFMAFVRPENPQRPALLDLRLNQETVRVSLRANFGPRRVLFTSTHHIL